MIQTERLILRPWQYNDRAPFAAMGADPEVMRHFPALLSRAESDALVDRVDRFFADHGWGMWALERRADGAFLGFAGLIRVTFESSINGDVEIGWRLRRDAWGQGYAFEAARAALNWGLANLDVPRIVAMTVIGNTRSWGLMERLSMTRRPDLDFDHPNVPDDSILKPHIVYATDRA
jgi:RimJ/RimL family protein N-acetyltransferase